MPSNDFLVFGGGSSPNVIDQATYAALTARQAGFQSGTALSAQLNKVWRQSSIMAAVLAQFTANYSGQNSVDDGTTATLLTNLVVALNAAGITAGQFDNSTKQATTAFVQRALGNFQAFTAYTSSQTLTASQSGSVINFWGGSASTFTLPSAATMPSGGAFLFNNTSTSAAVTITRAGSDTILLNGGGTSIVLNPGDSLLIAQAGGAQWVVTGGSVQLPYAAVMSGANWTTQPQFDNSSRLATTAFVQRAVGNFGSFSALNSNTTLTAFYAGQAIQWYGASGGVITLPPGSSMPSGGSLLFFNFGSGPITIATQGADFIWSAGVVQPVTLQVGDSLLLVSRGSTEWDVAGGTAAIQFTQTRGGTAVQFDNSTKLATTAFVQRALGSFSGFSGINANTTLTNSAAGKAIQFFSASSVTATLPLSSTMPLGSCITFLNNGGAVMMVSVQGADSINTASTGASSVGLQIGDTLTLMSRGTTEWDIVGGTAGLQFAPSRGVTPAAADNSTQLATTAWCNANVAPGRLLRTSVYFNNAGTLQVSINGGAFTNASSTFTPLAATSAVDVEVVGGGGGSGSTQTTGAGQFCATGGGQGGSYARGYFTSGFSGVTITCGAAGGGGPSGGNNGGNGGSSSFGSLMTAPGGNASVTQAPASNTSGLITQGGLDNSIATGGYINKKGQAGAFAVGISGTVIAPGRGGDSPLGSGGNSPGTIAAAVAGSGFGAGGGGAAIGASTASTPGAAGTSGAVIVREYD